MVKVEDLIFVYKDARKNKRRSLDSVVFEFDYERRIIELAKAINERTYRPTCNYTFVVTKPRHREIFAAELETRIIDHYIHWRIEPLMNEVLTNRTFNNRKGLGNSAAIKCLMGDIREVSNNFTDDAHIIKVDLKGCFPNADKNVAFRKMTDLVNAHYEGEDKEDLLWMIMLCAYSCPQDHCERRSGLEMWSFIEDEKSLFKKDALHGAAIGRLFWQDCMNLYYSDIDHWAVSEMWLHYCRFVDDMSFVVKNKEAALTYIIPELRRRLACVGSRLNEKKFYCQYWAKGVEYLGSHIKRDRRYLNNSTIYRGFGALSRLNNVPNKRSYIMEFQATVNSYLGMLKTCVNNNVIEQFVAATNNEWYNYLTYNEARRCFTTKKGHTRKDYIIYKYNLKTHRHDTGRKRQRTRRSV